MPVIAVAVAIGASAMAASSVAAVGLTIATALEVTAAVGATLSAVGTIAKIPGLQKAGMVIGAIGAVGSMASAAGLIDGSASLFGSSTPVTDAAVADAQAAGTVGEMGSTGGSSIGPWSEAQSLAETVPPEPPGGVGAVNPATGEVITAPTGGAGVAPEGPMILSSTNESVANPATTLADNTAAAAGKSASAPATATGTDATSTATGTTVPGATPVSAVTPTTPPAVTPGASAANAPAANASATNAPAGSDSGLWDGTKQVFSDLKGWAQKNPMLAYGMVQAGGSLLSGATSSLTPAQVALANAQADQNNAVAAQTKAQTAAMTQPKAVASLAPPVTGQTAPLVPTGATPTGQLASYQVTGKPQSFGLINQAPLTNQPQRAPATGVA
jgi:hypothetical protein